MPASNVTQRDHRLTHEHLALLFELSPSAVIQVNSAQIIVNFNAPLLQLLDYPADQLIGKSAAILFNSEDDYFNTIYAQAFLEHNQTLQSISAMAQVEHVLLRNAHDHVMIVNASVNRIITVTGEANTIIYFHDISPLVHAQQLINEKNEQLEKTLHNLHESQSMVLHQERLAKVGTMLAGVAHEVNNPVMGVLLNVEYALKRCTDDKTTEALQESREELIRVGKLVKGLLSFARKHDDKPHPISLHKLVQDAIKLADLPFKLNEHTIENLVSDDLPKVTASEDSLKQILMNLIVNANQAMKHMMHGRIVIDAWVLPNSQEVELRISDSGPGIPEHLKERIFEPFFTTKPASEGTGLGLSLCVTLAHQFGATLALDHEYTKGARFSLHIPIDPASQTKDTEVERVILSHEILSSLQDSVADDMRFVMEHFMQQLPQDIERIQLACAAADASSLKEAAHSLKGASILLGALALSHLCLKIETHARQNDLKSAQALLPKLHYTVDKTTAALRAFNIR